MNLSGCYLKQNIGRILSISAIALIATSCGKGSLELTPQAQESAPLHRGIEGPLTELVRKIGASEYAEECDHRQNARRLEVAQALDERATEIQSYANSLPESKRYKVVKFGPILARKLVDSEANKRPKPEWMEDTGSWEDIFSYYEKIKNDTTYARWQTLDGWVRGLVFDDNRRVIYGTNLYLDRTSGPSLKKVLEEVGACAQESQCSELILSTASQEFLKKNPLYRWYLRQFREITDQAKKRDLIKRFKGRLEDDNEAYAFTKNPTVSRQSPDRFEVALDPGPFAGFETEFAQWVESVWSTGSRKISIRWVSKLDLLEVFSLILDSGTGGRSFVRYGVNEVHLFPLVRLKSIAHEIGHVLGFTDHYYTTWNSESCEYRTQSNPADLMSDPDFGEVLPEEWNELDAQYPAHLN